MHMGRPAVRAHGCAERGGGARDGDGSGAVALLPGATWCMRRAGSSFGSAIYKYRLQR